jgi:hypothetical protein
VLGQSTWLAGPWLRWDTRAASWLAFVFPQHWWKIGGDGKKTSQTLVQYNFSWNFDSGCSVGSGHLKNPVHSVLRALCHIGVSSTRGLPWAEIDDPMDWISLSKMCFHNLVRQWNKNHSRTTMQFRNSEQVETISASILMNQKVFARPGFPVYRTSFVPFAYNSTPHTARNVSAWRRCVGMS